MRLLIPSNISKHTLLDVNGLKSDRALYKVWHTAAKLSHKTNLAVTKLSLSLIHNTIGLGLPMFINATTRQQISIYSIGPTDICLLVHHIWKSGVQKKFFFARSARESCFVPHLKIRGAAHAPSYSVREDDVLTGFCLTVIMLRQRPWQRCASY